MPSTKRTQLQRVHMTSECVRAESARKRTPREQIAVRDAGGGDDHLLRREIVDREHALHVLDAVLAGALDLGAARRPELRLQLAAEAAQRRRGEHRLARAADADREVVVRAAHRRADRRDHVAVLNQLDPRACSTDLLDRGRDDAAGRARSP